MVKRKKTREQVEDQVTNAKRKDSVVLKDTISSDEPPAKKVYC